MPENAALADRIAIADLTSRLVHAQDTRDWDAFRALLDESVHLDISRHLDAAPADLTAEQFTERSRAALTGFTATHHATSNVLVEVRGDEAMCRAYVVAYHYLAAEPAGFCTMRGYWHLSVRRNNDKWRIRGVTVIRTVPLEGDGDLYARAAKVV